MEVVNAENSCGMNVIENANYDLFHDPNGNIGGEAGSVKADLGVHLEGRATCVTMRNDGADYVVEPEEKECEEEDGVVRLIFSPHSSGGISYYKQKKKDLKRRLKWALLFALSICVFFLLMKYLVGGKHLKVKEDVLNGDAFSTKAINEDFVKFKRTFNKMYLTLMEQRQRLDVFRENLAEIKRWNWRAALVESSGRAVDAARFAVNQFADMSREELVKYLMPPLSPATLMRTRTKRDVNSLSSSSSSSSFSDESDEEWETASSILRDEDVRRALGVGFRRPLRVDWRERGVVTPVKNQGQCGSCWAFAVTAAVESQQAIHNPNGTLMTLSEQELLDCDLDNNACDGGSRYTAFYYVKQNGLVRDDFYKYVARRQRCRLPSLVDRPRVHVDQVRYLSTDEDHIADWIAANGPVTFGMNVTQEMFFYRSGIFDPTPDHCAQRSLGSHAMEVVGYDVTSPGGLPYWILKNSWGAAYGTQGGYLYMRRGVDACGLARQVYAALINN